MTASDATRRTSVALERAYRIVDPFHIEREEKTHLKPTFVTNQIRTSKYTLVNFLPICLLQEFKRSANLYFLAIAILQSIKLISPLTPFTAIAPLVMVVSVSLLREALEDHKRRTSDRVINGKQVSVIRNFDQQTLQWQQIQVGDIVKISERDVIPADGILMASCEDDGSCFIDTSNLDGEANLKSREALKVTCSFTFAKEEREKMKYFVKCDQPDQDLYRFSGNLSMDHGAKLVSLSEKQFLLRGSTLMNTKWIYMLVVYTGHETKIMKNARDPHHKMSHVESMMNKTVVVVFALEMVLCAIAAAVHHVQKPQLSHWYMGEYGEEDMTGSFLLFLSFIVLMNTLIPISLVVTVEVIKGAHAKFIMWDTKMRNPLCGAPAIANTSSLTDELGQVKYIFTDKTGTLTMNQMAFRKCSVDGVVYAIADRMTDSIPCMNASRAVSISSLDVVPPLPFHQQHQQQQQQPQATTGTSTSGSTSASTSTSTSSSQPLSRHESYSTLYPPMGMSGSDTSCPSGVQSAAIFKRFLHDLDATESRLALAMAICHTVVCEADPSNALAGGDVTYNSDSPDECALVRGAISMGVKLLARNGHQLFLSVTEEAREKSYIKTVTYTVSYEILRVLHFTSDRKRMSIIVRDAENRIKLICKGADSVILDRCDAFLSPQQITMDHVTQFAAEGFRILLFAERILDDKFYDSWEARYHEAELDMHAKEQKTEALVDEMERKLTLIGSSAVEDKLQEGVPETISLFQKAGIKIWVLTGDKLETSLEMGKLCRVVTPGMKEVILQAVSRSEMSQKLDEAIKDARENQALIIEGPSLTCALTPSNRDKFLQLALKSATVIVCRTSPLQKALVVEMVKNGVPFVTLAVGDGANDVSMIRSAHVGVGVVGQEGMQAVRSADYAVQQFSHLGRLVLHHGRLSYLRTSQCINYFFYKNIVFTLPQFIYGIVSAYSGQTFFCDLYITAYNVCFTALPVIARAIMETDLPEKMAETFPELYRSGAHNEYFSFRTFAKSSILATFHAIVLTLVPLICFQRGGVVASDGTGGGDLWSGSVASFFYIVPIVHFQIYLETWNWNSVVTFVYMASLLLFFVAIAVYDVFTSSIEGVWHTTVLTPLFWLGFALSTTLCVMPWLACQAFEENFVTTNPVHILRRVRYFNKILDASQWEKIKNEPTTTSPAGAAGPHATTNGKVVESR